LRQAIDLLSRFVMMGDDTTMTAAERSLILTDSPLTMDDIARLAGVDKSTVSRALAGSKLVSKDTRAHVCRIAEEHGYIVDSKARSLRSGRTRTIAVVIPLQHDKNQPVSDPFFMEMVAHLADCLAERDYHLLLSKVTKPSPLWLSALDRTRKADGIILVGQSLEHEQIAAAAKNGVKLVVWGAKLPDPRYITVGTDNREGGRLATAHLIERGRRAIAFLGDCRLPEIRQRCDGYLDALSAVGLPHDPFRVIPSLFEATDAQAAMQKLLASGTRFDAIVAASDVIAIAAMRTLTAAGRRVPQDIAITGFDDIAMAAHTNPTLTTIRQDIPRGAAFLADRIIELIEGRDAESLEMAPALIVRGSS
jgi:DNA-binding LacI/PurR family transcriptional regulator